MVEQVVIKDEDLKIETWPSRNPGGQQVSCTSNGVKVEHLPSGLVAIVDTHRSQHRNLAIARDMILSGLTNPLY